MMFEDMEYQGGFVFNLCCYLFCICIIDRFGGGLVDAFYEMFEFLSLIGLLFDHFDILLGFYYIGDHHLLLPHLYLP